MGKPGPQAEPERVEGAAGPRVLELDGLPAQMAFWEDTTDLAVLGLVGAWGTGKTRSLIIKDLTLHLINYQATGRCFRTMLVEPTFGMVEDILLPAYEEVIQGEMGIPVEITGTSGRPEVRWPRSMTPWVGNGHKLQQSVTTLRSAEKPRRLVGPNLMAVGLDEPAHMEYEAYKRARPRARHPLAAVRQTHATMTPEGLGWCAEIFDDPKPPVRTIRAREWHASYSWYPGVLRDTFKGSDAELATYLGGRFVPLMSGRCYKSFDAKVIRRPRYSEALPLLLACDFNIDNMRWLICQIFRNPRGRGGRINVLDEIALGADGDVGKAAVEFLERWGPKGSRQRHQTSVIILGDASGSARSQTGHTCYRELQNVLRGHFRDLSKRVPKANPRVRDRVDTVNWHLRGAGGWEVWADPDVVELRKDWERNVWVKGRADIEQKKSHPDDQRTHAGAAFGYLVCSLLPMPNIRQHGQAKRTRLHRARIRNPAIDGGW